MYTIEELEHIAADGTLQLRSDGTAHLALTLASQLLDTMRENARLRARITELETFGDAAMMVEHAQMRARIEAAAGIAARDQDAARWNGSAIVKAEAATWNECRAEFRAALGLD